jgi:PAS domain S-box-containing protein
MKPRPYVHVAPFSTPAFTEALGQSPGRAIAFSLFVDAAQSKPSKQWRERTSKLRDRQMEEHTTKSHSTTSSPSLPGRRNNQDRSFEFTLSPQWSSWSAARSAKELFLITRDLLAAIAFEGGLKVIHPAFQKVLGHREHPFLEVPMMEFLPQNDGRPRSGKKTTRALALYFEACYECGNGSSRWLGWNIFSKPDENRLYCIARDITEAKSAADLANKMHRMFHVSGDLFCVLDSRGHFQLANPAFQKLLGFPPQHLVRTAFADLVHHRDRRKATAILGTAAREETVFFVARCGCHPTGHKRVAWRAVAVPAEELIYCVGRDVTGLKVVEKPSAAAEQALVNIAQLSNDINNPLEAMVNLLFLLKSGRLPQREHGRYIDMAEKQVFRIARVLQRML